MTIKKIVRVSPRGFSLSHPFPPFVKPVLSLPKEGIKRVFKMKKLLILSIVLLTLLLPFLSACSSDAQNTIQTLVLKGDVTATASTTGDNGTIKQITFTMSSILGAKQINFTQPTRDITPTGLAAAGSFNKVSINYYDDEQTVKNLYWTFTPLGKNNGDVMLASYENFQIAVGGAATGSGAGSLIDALAPDLSANQTFTLELVTSAGVVLQIQRTTPAYIDTTMELVR
jgi:archaellin